ncbi:uncharacterized protein PHALS_03951 [Plasmopara halstedii]|uniref:Uncharacterized protein n=1 Tax=Plasmopara halstedii TaxID=4781 RepID=A0A0P1AZY0_PLAHL|nr:uncharacterized protein PHALS_03951 [Plasmopara halstedii]CEG47296.1 hypothetical protein PHALS_03951 [Plasmopara halstedii]|eukprot:XP_024583665.1 hypothetical protein PHALS_03951 [Plasmopara halstedii]
MSAAVVQLIDLTGSWRSKKQISMALLSTDVKYDAATVGTQELLGLKELLGELDIATTHQETVEEAQVDTILTKAENVNITLDSIRDFAKKSVVMPEAKNSGFC